MKIGCLGPSGTFSEQAALEYIKISGLSHSSVVCYNTIDDAISAAANGETSKTVAPLENIIEGTVNATLDALVFQPESQPRLFIEYQLTLPITQNLLINGDGSVIETVLSHPQALAQSRQFLRRNYPHAKLIPVASTAEAARIVSEVGSNTAAIGNIFAANLYGLKILHKGIQDNDYNATLFAVLTQTDTSEPKPGCKTSIAFSTINKPGELYKLLDIFALWDLNMTKIQSRPMKGKPGEYVFFVDIDGYRDDISDVKDALKMAARKTSFFKNLGSYMNIVIQDKPY